MLDSKGGLFHGAESDCRHTLAHVGGHQARIVSFHEEEGCELLEFRSHELFLNCVDQYAGRQFRYQ